MTAKLVMLVLAAASLAACTTATTTTEDLSVRRGASPTRGEISHHKVVVRGPVVPDTVVASHASVSHHAVASRPAVASHPAVASRATTARATTPKPVTTTKFAAREVPNPLRQAKPAAPAATATASAATGPAATAPAASEATPGTGLPTEPPQAASVTEPSQEATPLTPQSAVGDLPIQETSSEPNPAPAPSGQSPLAMLGLGSLTPQSIEHLFGGMPFMLIAALAAALVATFGLAIRPKPEEPEYEEPRVDHHDEDYREPYAA
jgi:hypothetical protein